VVDRDLIYALQALRGVSLITAATLIAEVGDFNRFNNPQQLMSYAGLVPGENSSGSSRHQGKITKAGNSICSSRVKLALSVSTQNWQRS
jgi:transposase